MSALQKNLNSSQRPPPSPIIVQLLLIQCQKNEASMAVYHQETYETKWLSATCRQPKDKTTHKNGSLLILHAMLPSKLTPYRGSWTDTRRHKIDPVNSCIHDKCHPQTAPFVSHELRHI